MSGIDPVQMRAAFAVMDGLEGASEKGHALETLVGEMFGQIPGLKLFASDLKDEAGAEELDLVFHNNVHESDGLWMFNFELIVECKNWSKPVGSSELAWFVEKLRGADQQIGVFVAARGITGDPRTRTQAVYEVQKARLMTPKVFVVIVTRAELEEVRGVRDLVDLLRSKLTMVRIFGRIDGQPRQTVPSAAEMIDKAEAEPIEPAAEGVSSSPRRAAGIFEGVNARALDSPTIGRRFIATPAFWQLAQARDALIVGARGTGKTTLLRMLQAETFESWAATEPDIRRERIPRGVYLPMAPTSLGNPKDPESELVAGALYATDVLRRIVRALAGVHERLELGANVERSAVEAVSKAAGLEEAPGSFDELQARIHARWESCAAELRRLDLNATMTLQVHTMASTDFYITATAVLHAWSAVTGDREPWSLLLDDFDLAPRFVQLAVAHGWRSGDALLSVKVAGSPAMPELVASWTSHIHDVALVRLPSRRSAEQFLAAILADLLPAGTDPQQVFGRSPAAPEAGLQADAAATKAIAHLRKVDPSFVAWLSSVGIDPDDSLMSPALRKVLPFIVLRGELLAHDGTLRGRAYSLYWSGMPILLRVCDGNPRYFLSLMDAVSTTEPGTAVAASTQCHALRAMTDNFLGALKLMGAGPEAGTALKVVDRIGTALHNRFWGPFTPDPVLHFTVDQVSSDVERALQVALNAGAVIEVDNSETYGGTLHGRRFRLTYLLAPHYALPVALGRPAPLGELLREVP